MNNTPFPEGKVIVLRLVGGFLDGVTYRSDVNDGPNLNYAKAYWHVTSGGQIGKGFQVGSPAGIEEMIQRAIAGAPPAPGHDVAMYTYHVVDRQETYSEVIVECKYSGIAQHGVFKPEKGFQ